MIRQKQIVNNQNGTIYYEVIFEVLTKQLIPNELYEQIEDIIERKIYEYQPNQK